MRFSLFTFMLLSCLPSLCHAETLSKPNVLIILSDDQGWADVGFNGSSDIPTPHLDALAEDGVIFSQGYATHPYCSPSRAGLLSGRYQHRFGHENNTPYVNVTEHDGIPASETLLSDVMKSAGYKTAAIGKWHLGDHSNFSPNNRGFDKWFGFSAGNLDFWGDLGNKPSEFGMQRDGQSIPKSEISYLTDDFSNEASSYIRDYTSKNQPFFMYLAYNAPHSPMQAPQKYLDKVAHIEDGTRAVYAAMVAGMDAGIGDVINTLKETGAYDNTLIFFYSDNGGKTTLGASNTPFRGHKGMLFEGGIRVPFLVSWPKGFKGGFQFDGMVSALDIFPTILNAAGIDAPKKKLDGKNLLPALTKQVKSSPHKTLYWRYSEGAGWAVLHDNYKLIYSAYKNEHLLFNMKNDAYEQYNTANKHPEIVSKLSSLYNEWSKYTVTPLWKDPHLENVEKEEDARQQTINKAMSGEQK